VRIRKAVACAVVATFIAVFGAIYVQMALGKDPALGTSSTKAITTSKTTTAQVTSKAKAAAATPTHTAPSTSTSSGSSSSPSAVTTRQS
jgi:hypothetical protein